MLQEAAVTPGPGTDASRAGAVLAPGSEQFSGTNLTRLRRAVPARDRGFVLLSNDY